MRIFMDRFRPHRQILFVRIIRWCSTAAPFNVEIIIYEKSIVGYVTT